MKINPKLETAVAVFRDLGWDTADRAEMCFLSLGDKDHQKAALSGLKSGDLTYWSNGELRPVPPLADIDLTMFRCFAIRLGISANRARSIVTQSDMEVVAAAVACRDDDFVRSFAETVCRKTNRFGEHNATFYGEIAVTAMCVKELPPIENFEYLKDWAVFAGRSLGGATEPTLFPPEAQDIPEEILLPTAIEHLVAAIEQGVRVSGPLGAAITGIIERGLVPTEGLIGAAIRALEASVRPSDRRRWIEILTNYLGFEGETLYRHRVDIYPLIATSESLFVTTFGIPLLANTSDSGLTDAELIDVALGCLYSSTLAAQRGTVQALRRRQAPSVEVQAALAARLTELAHSTDDKLADAAGRLLNEWNIEEERQPAVANSEPTVRCWQPTPPTWSPARFEKIPATVESLSDLIRIIRSRASESDLYFGQLPDDLKTEQLSLAIYELAKKSPTDLQSVTQMVGIEPWSTIIRDWERGELKTNLGVKQYSIGAARLAALMATVEENLPAVLSEPSYGDLSIDVEDLIERIRCYQKANRPVQEADLALALARLREGALNDDAARDSFIAERGIQDLDVAVRSNSGEIVGITVGTIVAKYLKDPFTEETVTSSKEWANGKTPAVVSAPLSLRQKPNRLVKNCKFAPEPGTFPTWRDVTARGLVWNAKDLGAAAILAEQFARSSEPLSATTAINLLGLLRPAAHPASARVAEAVDTAWRRGLLLPGVPDFATLDWAEQKTHLALFAAGLAGCAETGMLALVWPVLDDALSYAAAQASVPSGTAEIAEIMAHFAPDVRSAVVQKIAPPESLLVPGLRELATKSGNSKAVKWAKAAVAELDAACEPKQD